MGTLIKMKAEVVNPELPVVTEHGILPYYAGIYVNKLADMGITFTQAEANALAAFINTINDAGVLNKIDSFYPFMGNVNVPLIGSTELTFANTTSTNTKLDFVDGKLRGAKGFDSMPTVKYKDLTSFNKGFNIGLSMISKTVSSVTRMPLFELNNGGAYPVIQMKYQNSGTVFAGTISELLSSSSSGSIIQVITDPYSDTLHNYSFVCGLVNENYADEPINFTKTTIKDNTILVNEAGKQSTVHPFQTTDITEYQIGAVNADSVNGKVVTTLAFFNELLTADQGKVFCQALDTFTAAVGKTVSVG